MTDKIWAVADDRIAVIDEETSLKENLIRLVNHHRETCAGPTCNISLYLVRKVATKEGLTFTADEGLLFI